MDKLRKELNVLVLVSCIFLFSTGILYIVAGSNCLFKAVIGIPCPTCGMTRAWISFLQGNIILTFFYHPLFWTIPILCGYIVYNKLKEKKENTFVIGAFCIAFIGVYIVRMLYLFPNTIPMDYHNGSILSRFFHIIQNITNFFS